MNRELEKLLKEKWFLVAADLIAVIAILIAMPDKRDGLDTFLVVCAILVASLIVVIPVLQDGGSKAERQAEQARLRAKLAEEIDLQRDNVRAGHEALNRRIAEVEMTAQKAAETAAAAVAAAEKAVLPAQAEVAAVTKERSAHLVEREKLAAPGVAAEKDYAAKLPALQASVQKAKDGLPALEKALVAVRAQLAEAGKPVEAKRLLVEAAAKTLELTKSEKANAEKALAAAQKDIPQRDKNLEEVAKSYAELTPQVEPMKAKVKAAQDQYLAMLPKREEGKKN